MRLGWALAAAKTLEWEFAPQDRFALESLFAPLRASAQRLQPVPDLPLVSGSPPLSEPGSGLEQRLGSEMH